MQMRSQGRVLCSCGCPCRVHCPAHWPSTRWVPSWPATPVQTTGRPAALEAAAFTLWRQQEGQRRLKQLCLPRKVIGAWGSCTCCGCAQPSLLSTSSSRCLSPLAALYFTLTLALNSLRLNLAHHHLDSNDTYSLTPGCPSHPAPPLPLPSLSATCCPLPLPSSFTLPQSKPLARSSPMQQTQLFCHTQLSL